MQYPDSLTLKCSNYLLVLIRKCLFQSHVDLCHPGFYPSAWHVNMLAVLLPETYTHQHLPPADPNFQILASEIPLQGPPS